MTIVETMKTFSVNNPEILPNKVGEHQPILGKNCMHFKKHIVRSLMVNAVFYEEKEKTTLWFYDFMVFSG